MRMNRTEALWVLAVAFAGMVFLKKASDDAARVLGIPAALVALAAWGAAYLAKPRGAR